MSYNTELVRTAITTVFVEHETTGFTKYWAEDYVQHNPTFPDGTAHLAGAVASIGSALHYEIGAILGAGDLVMVHGRFTGMTPKPVVAVDIFRVEGDKIVEHWDVLQEDVPADQAVGHRPMFPTTDVPAEQSERYATERQNMTSFHIADFVGWNNRDWDLLRRYHTHDVIVDMGGEHTDTVEPHIDFMRQVIGMYEGAQIVEHAPSVAEGAWTGIVGHVTPQQFKMATVAKWRDGRIAEEHIFLNELTDPAWQPPTGSTVMADFATPDDEELRVAVGVEPGWRTVVYLAEDGTKTAVFSRELAGQDPERFVFAEV